MGDAATHYWWLSYADQGGWRGAVIVHAETFLDACAQARTLGISPGGQVRGVGPMTLSLDDLRTLRPFLNRLLDKAEADETERLLSS